MKTPFEHLNEDLLRADFQREWGFGVMTTLIVAAAIVVAVIAALFFGAVIEKAAFDAANFSQFKG